MASWFRYKPVSRELPEMPAAARDQAASAESNVLRLGRASSQD
jgi:hypothetical protein